MTVEWANNGFLGVYFLYFSKYPKVYIEKMGIYSYAFRYKVFKIEKTILEYISK